MIAMQSEALSYSKGIAPHGAVAACRSGAWGGAGRGQCLVVAWRGDLVGLLEAVVHLLHGWAAVHFHAEAVVDQLVNLGWALHWHAATQVIGSGHTPFRGTPSVFLKLTGQIWHW